MFQCVRDMTNFEKKLRARYRIMRMTYCDRTEYIVEEKHNILGLPFFWVWSQLLEGTNYYEYTKYEAAKEVMMAAIEKKNKKTVILRVPVLDGSELE